MGVRSVERGAFATGRVLAVGTDRPPVSVDQYSGTRVPLAPAVEPSDTVYSSNPEKKRADGADRSLRERAATNRATAIWRTEPHTPSPNGHGSEGRPDAASFQFPDIEPEITATPARSRCGRSLRRDCPLSARRTLARNGPVSPLERRGAESNADDGY